MNEQTYLFSKSLADMAGKYYTTRKLIDVEKKSQRGLVLSAFDYVSQKPLQNRKEKSDFGKNMIHLNRSLENLHRNLNYSSSLEEWRQFYKFPQADQIRTYIDELKDELVDGETPFVVNKNSSTVNEYVKRILGLYSDERCMISFLNGTTGVGKTTFLKFFTKTRKPTFLKKGVIVSRVKFRDIESIYENVSPKGIGPLNRVFSKHVLDGLFRDIIDSYKIANGQNNIPNEQKEALSKLFEVFEGYLLEKFTTDFDEKVSKIAEGDEGVLAEVEPEFKSKLVSKAHDLGLKFCIILDGFDAIRPEEIQLFGEGDEDSFQGDFFKCLSAVIKQSFEIDTPEGRLINKLNKSVIIAARPTTIFQLKVEIQDEVDFDHVFSHEVYVIGSDLFGIIENRIRVFYMNKTTLIAPPDDLIVVVNKCILKAIDVLYDAHSPTLERGRFIDLFNHNIREKLVFIRSLIAYMIDKVEIAYVGSRLHSLSFGKLSISEFSELLNLEAHELGIDLYEVQKLLILPDDGRFKNHFIYNTDQSLVPASHKGPFDNIFNYLKFSSKYGYEDAKKKGWPIDHDPILSKFLILHYLTLRPKNVATVTTIEEWFEDEFTHLTLDYLDLKLLIRGGFIEIRRIDSSPHAFLTRKGEFLIKELISSSIYLEHVVLNCRLPLYVADLIVSPKSPERRNWGRISVVNVLIFLMYLRSVSEQIPSTRELDIPSIIDGLFEGVKDSYPGIISEGLKEEGDAYGQKLAKEMRRINIISLAK